MLDVTDGTYTADTEVAHFYVLGDGNQNLKLWYKGPKENNEITITGVPVSANTHITLKGDIYNAGRHLQRQPDSQFRYSHYIYQLDNA